MGQTILRNFLIRYFSGQISLYFHVERVYTPKAFNMRQKLRPAQSHFLLVLKRVRKNNTRFSFLHFCRDAKFFWDALPNVLGFCVFLIIFKAAFHKHSSGLYFTVGLNICNLLHCLMQYMGTLISNKFVGICNESF